MALHEALLWRRTANLLFRDSKENYFHSYLCH